MHAAHLVPAVILAALARGGLEVDLLPVVLADVGDEEVARLAVERERPGIGDAESPDLGLRPLLIFENSSSLTPKSTMSLGSDAVAKGFDSGMP
jgi:hypothetical protein